MIDGLTFDPEYHVYHFNGVKIPNVTGILDPLYDFTSVAPDVLARACEFGSHVHSACELHDLGTLDRNELDPALVPYLNGWIKFLSMCPVEFDLIEKKVFSQRYKYAGTLDRAGLFRGKKSIIDIKTGLEYPATGPQTAAYAQAHFEETGERIRKRFTVLLRPENFKLVEHSSKNDFNVFMSCLNIRNYLESYK